MEGNENYSKARTAIKEGNLDHLKRLLLDKGLTQISDDDGRRLIHFAAIDAPTTECLLEVLKHELDSVNWENKYGYTPLWAAILRKDETEFARVLLQNGADPNKPKDMMLEVLLKQDVEVVNDLNIVESLVEAGADVNFSDFYGWTPLHVASEKQDPTFVDLLLKSGANIDVKNSGAATPIHCAVRRFCLRTLKTILAAAKERGSSCINWVNTDGDTALFMACRHKVLSKDFVKTLLQSGADPNIQNIKKKGKTPLLKAIAAKNEAVVKILLVSGADVNVSDFRGTTPLHIAARIERPIFVQLLLEKDANVYAKNVESETPLHWASKIGCVKNLKALLVAATEKGEVKDLINIKSSNGTALSIAAKNGFVTCEETLLEFGADPNVS